MIPGLHSPLLGTAIVIVGMSATAVPLVRLTAHSDNAIKPIIQPNAAHFESETIPAILRIRTIAPLEKLEITSGTGSVIYQSESLEAGEVEADVELPWTEGEAFLTISAHAGEQETAVFLTVMPDGYEEQTAYTIGAGEFGEELSFDWDTE